MASYTRVNWLNKAAGGTKLGAINLNVMDAGIDGLYSLPNAKGDLIVATAADTLDRLAVGSSDQVLVADSAQSAGVKWAAVPGLSAYVPLATVDAKGDLLVGTAADTVGRLAVGTNDYVLTADSAQATGMKWAAAASSGATVATTVAGLGAGSTGDLGLLRLGTTPYDFLPLIYDSTYAKWVSPVFTVAASGVRSLSASGLVATGPLPSYKAHTDAGLTLMLMLYAVANRPGGSSTSTTIALNTYEYDGDDNTITSIDSSLVSTSHTMSADSYAQTAWAAAGAPASAAHGLVQAYATLSNAGTSEATGATVLGRWVG